MTDRDLEDRLRRWLAARAPRDVPPALAARAGSIPRAVGTPVRRGWSTTHVAFAASAVVVAIAVTLAGLNLLGFVEGPRPGSNVPCSPENLERAIAALDRVPGYRYVATGRIERWPRPPVPGTDETQAPPDVLPVSFEGEYIAPDRVHVRYAEGSEHYFGIEEVITVGERAWFLAPRTRGQGPGSEWRESEAPFWDAELNPVRHWIWDGIEGASPEDWIAVDGSGMPGDDRPSCTLEYAVPRPGQTLPPNTKPGAIWAVRIDVATDLPISVRQELVAEQPVLSGNSWSGRDGVLILYEVIYEEPTSPIEPPASAVPATAP